MSEKTKKNIIFILALSSLFILIVIMTTVLLPKKEEACPFSNVEDFVEKYIEDISIQQKFSKYPLKSSYIDNMKLEEKIEFLKKEDVKFPIIPNRAKQQKLGLNKKELKQIGPDRWELRLSKEDTDFLLRFIFEKNGCWQLTEDRNDSL